MYLLFVYSIMIALQEDDNTRKFTGISLVDQLTPTCWHR